MSLTIECQCGYAYTVTAEEVQAGTWRKPCPNCAADDAETGEEDA